MFAKKDSQELENDDEKKQENNENDRNSNPLIKYLSNDLKNIYLKETSVLYEDMPIIFNISDPENLALFIQKNYNIQISAEKILETLDAATLTAENTEILFSVVNVSDNGKIEGNLIAPNAGIVVDRAGNVITLKLQIASK